MSDSKINPADLAKIVEIAVRVVPGLPILAQELVSTLAREVAHYYALYQQGATLAEIEHSTRARVQPADWADLKYRLETEATNPVNRPDEGSQ